MINISEVKRMWELARMIFCLECADRWRAEDYNKIHKWREEKEAIERKLKGMGFVNV